MKKLLIGVVLLFVIGVMVAAARSPEFRYFVTAGQPEPMKPAAVEILEIAERVTQDHCASHVLCAPVGVNGNYAWRILERTVDNFVFQIEYHGGDSFRRLGHLSLDLIGYRLIPERIEIRFEGNLILEAHHDQWQDSLVQKENITILSGEQITLVSIDLDSPDRLGLYTIGYYGIKIVKDPDRYLDPDFWGANIQIADGSAFTPRLFPFGEHKYFCDPWWILENSR